MSIAPKRYYNMTFEQFVAYHLSKGNIVISNNGCWLWTGALNNDGYASLNIDGKNEKGHKAFWEKKNGRIPPGFESHHACPNKPVRRCVNPDHIEIVTHQDNCKKDFTKLTRQQEIEILRLYFNDGKSTTELGPLFNVSHATIGNIIKSYGLKLYSPSERQRVWLAFVNNLHDK